MQLHKRTIVEDYTTREKHVAEIVRLTPELATSKLQDVWWGLIDCHLDWRPEDEVDYHWYWPHLVGKDYASPEFSCLGLQTEDSLIQAAVIYRRKAKAALVENGFAVFVEYVASAPWNRRNVARSPKFVAAGFSCLLCAIRDSYLMGYGGRTSLVPADKKGASWYEKIGFLQTPCRDDDDNPIWELPSNTAVDTLKECRQKGFFLD